LCNNKTLRKETEGKTTLIGFMGAPWTLAAYAVEGGHSKLCTKFKRMCLEEPAVATQLLDKLTDSLCAYASHQVRILRTLSGGWHIFRAIRYR
jgi:uroporphyrinogen decarboxylase